MKEEIFEMSRKELDKSLIIQKVQNKELTQRKAAELLHLKSDRQVRYLLTSYKKHGTKGLISKRRGISSNRAYDLKFKGQVMSIICERYPDFGPTLIAEKLSELHSLTISDETIRNWMIERKMWFPRQKHKKIYPLRPRRDYFGELIQIDGSHHHWFEDRGKKCALIVFIDDATGKLTSLHFCKSECLEGYFIALKQHILKYGRPLNLYSDRHAIFGGSDKIQHAQLIRAIKELEITSILAHSPQAKGRVERVNKTLQDRLVKEMRLRNICSMEEANKFLPKFIEDFNKKFSKEPRGQFDTHRPLASSFNLERILTRVEIRTLTKDLSFSFHNTTYQILETLMINRLKNKQIEIRQEIGGIFKVFYLDKELKFLPLKECYERVALDIKNKKIIGQIYKGNHNKKHPWRIYFRAKLPKDKKAMI